MTDARQPLKWESGPNFQRVRDAHNRAMEALAADIHPYAHGAIVEWEKVMDAALDALTALAERAERWMSMSASADIAAGKANIRAVAAEARAEEAEKTLAELREEMSL